MLIPSDNCAAAGSIVERRTGGSRSESALTPWTIVQRMADATHISARVAGYEESSWNVHTSLELLEELYNYNHWLFNKVRPFIKGSVCEIGSGTGKMTQFLLNQERIVCVEPFETSVATSRERFEKHLNVKFVQRFLHDCPNDDLPAGSVDSVICLNVLEHLEDDVENMRCMKRLITDRGRVIVLVPAHMSIYGAMDRSFGHYRRYNRRTLGRVFEQADLRVKHSFYINTIGYFGWLWHGRIRQREQIPLKSARLFNRLVPFLAAIERLIRLPFGQSLVMIGTPRR